jgi:predicted HTH domain antitoxin
MRTRHEAATGLYSEQEIVMATKTVRVNLEIPEGISDQIRHTVQTRAEEAVVLALWESGEISTGRAAEELALSYRDFLDLISARGIPMVSGGEINTEGITEAQRRIASDAP